MFIIEIILKGSPVTLSVQRKSAEEATQAYEEISTAMRENTNKFLELTCDRQTEKKIAIFSGDIAAVQMYEKSSTGTSGRSPGFLAMAE